MSVPRPVILAVAPNGARSGKADHPRLPMSMAEIVDACAECVEQGATMLHVHVRDGNGRHLLDADAARDLEAALIDQIGNRALVQTTTEAFGLYSAAEQVAFLRQARPIAASVAWREISREDVTEAERAALLAWCRTENIALQYILYDLGDIAAFQSAIERGIVPEEHPRVLFVVGRYASGEPSDARALAGFLASGIDPSSWMACAFGVSGHDVLHAAALLGGHARIGFENGFVTSSGTIARDNAELVAGLRDTLGHLGRRPAKADETLQLLLQP
jgi:3-keto-5-aminohexanoate cleavage enzyme